MSARGVRQLEIGSSVALTDEAKERAEQLGIVLVTPGSAPAAKPATTAAPAKGGCLAEQAAGLSAWTFCRKAHSD